MRSNSRWSGRKVAGLPWWGSRRRDGRADQQVLRHLRLRSLDGGISIERADGGGRVFAPYREAVKSGMRLEPGDRIEATLLPRWVRRECDDRSAAGPEVVGRIDRDRESFTGRRLHWATVGGSTAGRVSSGPAGGLLEGGARGNSQRPPLFPMIFCET
jgi:hypothetical protein